MATTKAATTKTAIKQASVADVEDVIDDLANDPATAAIISESAAKIPLKARRVIYVVGIALGAIVAVAAAVNGTLTGNVGEAVGSLGGLAYSLSNLLAVAHLNVDPTVK